MSMTAEQRYLHDPIFKRLVDFIYHGIVEHQFTPTEVRDAAMVASMKYEMNHARPLFVPAGDFLRMRQEGQDHG